MYSDESGSISYLNRNKKFVVALIIPANPRKFKNDLKRIKLKFCKANGLSPKTEIKGSSLTDEQLEIFFNHFINDLRVFYSTLDCNSCSENMLLNPKITHNFMLGKIFERFYDNHIVSNGVDSVADLTIDNVNNGVKHLMSTEVYLNTTFGLKNPSLISNVQYVDSSHHISVQAVDIFSHYFYRKYCKNIEVLHPNISVRKVH